jgi:O-antigen ligase
MPRAAWAPGVVAAALILLLGFDQGGYAPASWVWSAVLLAIVAGALGSGRPSRPAPLEWVFVAVLGGLLAWTLFSALWSLDPTGSLLDAQRLLLYLATVATLVLLARPAAREAILLGVLGGIAVLCLAGLGDAVVGDDPVGAVTADPGSEDRLSEPVGYANALALLAATGILLALGLARARAGAVRLACLVLVPAFLATLFLTYSRGGWLALVAGFIAAVAISLHRIDRRLAVPLVALILVAFAVAGIAVARSFDAPTATPAGGAARLSTLSGSSRGDYWRVVWRDVQDHPALGSGAGSYGRYWLRERPVPQPARDAHSLFLETLAELGPFGLGLLLVAFGAPLLAAWRTRRDALTPPAVGAVVAYGIHAAQDWDWELPAATIPALACAVTLLLATRRDETTIGRGTRTAGAALASLLAVFTLAAYAGNRELALAENGSEPSARRAARLQPWSAQPLRVRGELQLARGDVRGARMTFLEALERDDADWELWLDLALATEGSERERALARASALNPRAPELAELREEP